MSYHDDHEDRPSVADADLEMAEGAAVGDAIHARQRAGVCCHQSAQGWIADPTTPEGRHLRPGQLACTAHVGGCAAVFASDDEWCAAMDAAIDGERWTGAELPANWAEAAR